MDPDQIPAELGLTQAWEKRPTGWWLTAPDLDVERMADCLAAWGARFVTITARPVSGGESRSAHPTHCRGECRVDYHWDLAGQLLTFVTCTQAGRIASIAARCPAADWVEREVHDYFAVDFVGRAASEPLVLRPGDPPGVFRPTASDKALDPKRNGGGQPT